jgi:hypothetical protein
MEPATKAEKERIFDACFYRLCRFAGVSQLTSAAGLKAGYAPNNPGDVRAVADALEYGRMAAGLYDSWAAFEASILWTAIRDLPRSPRLTQ